MSPVPGVSAPRLLAVAELVVRRWWPDALLGAAVLGFGVLTFGLWDPVGSRVEGLLYVIVSIGMAVASGLFRMAPGVALGLV